MHWIDANGVSLHYRLEGGAEKPLLVLLHEMGGCLDSWDLVVPAITAQFRCLRFDMRGAGMSEKRRDAFGIADLGNDLAQLLDALALSHPVALAGCAVGAATALHFAAKWPRQVTKVIAFAPATGLAAERKLEVLALAAQFEQQGIRARILQRFDHSYPKHYFASAQERAEVLGRLLSHDPWSYAATYRMLCALDMDADLAAIECPVRVVAGRHDGTRPPEALRAVAAMIQGAEFRVIDSGHVMPILSPALVAAELLDFLRQDGSAT